MIPTREQFWKLVLGGLNVKQAIRNSIPWRHSTLQATSEAPARYSEDIDLVQVSPGPAGSMLGDLHEVLDPSLDKPQRKQTTDGITLAYRFESGDTPPIRLRLKIEIDSLAHFSAFGFKRMTYRISLAKVSYKQFCATQAPSGIPQV